MRYQFAEFNDLKNPVILDRGWTPSSGYFTILECDNDFNFRDLIVIDKTKWAVTRTIVTHPSWCRYLLIEYGKLKELMRKKYE